MGLVLDEAWIHSNMSIINHNTTTVLILILTSMEDRNRFVESASWFATTILSFNCTKRTASPHPKLALFRAEMFQ
jgi:hypothetical protein